MRFTIYALPLLVLLLALFGFAVDIFDLEPQHGSVVKLVLFGSKVLPPHIVLATWLLEAAGLLAIYFLAQGRFGWLDGVVAGWIGWIFRGPLLVVTVVTGTGQVQQRWWKIALAWWVLYTICGLALTILDRRMSRTPPSSRTAPTGSGNKSEDRLAPPPEVSMNNAPPDGASADRRWDSGPEVPEQEAEEPVVSKPYPEDFETAPTVELPSEPGAESESGADRPMGSSEDETRS